MTTNSAHHANHTLVSLFAGAGGMDMGFENAGFETIWANDILPAACETHKQWSKAHTECGDIRKLDLSSIPRSSIITGGFPCQGFSLAGPRKVDDSRNVLYKFFVQLVDQNQPDVFVAENVKGILTLGGGQIIKAIIAEFEDKGYSVTANLINAADYGVPQDRHRVIIVGVRNDIGGTFEFPQPFSKRVTLKEAISGLGTPNTKDLCTAPYSSRYMSRNRKRNWDSVSYTIPAMAKQVPLHPSSPDMVKVGKDCWKFGSGETRRFSWRESALIQTFPSSLEFQGDLTSKYLQIGNAVPVKLAETVATAINKQFFD